MRKSHTKIRQLFNIMACATLLIASVAPFFSVNNVSASAGGPANCSAKVFQNLGIISDDSDEQYRSAMDYYRNDGNLDVSLASMYDAFASAKLLPKYGLYEPVFQFFRSYDDATLRNMNDAELTRITEILREKIAATGSDVNYNIGYPSYYETDFRRSIYAWEEITPDVRFYYDLYFFNLMSQDQSIVNSDNIDANEIYRRDYFLTAICTASQIDPNFKVNYVNGVDPLIPYDPSIPDIASGAPISAMVLECKEKYGVDGVTFGSDENISCGATVIGNWGMYPPEGVTLSQELQDVSKWVQACSEGKITLTNDGAVTCGGKQVATWFSEGGGPISIKGPDTASGGPSTDNPGSTSESLQQVANELRSLIDQIKNDPIFKFYQALIEAVRAAEDLLARIGGFNNARTMTLIQEPDQQEITLIIKRIGDAMRALGINTTIGQNADTFEIADLRGAIEAATTVEKYSEYAELAQAIEDAENALSNNSQTSVTLANLQSALASTKGDVVAEVPNTGISGFIGGMSSSIVVLLSGSVLVLAVGSFFITKNIAMKRMKS